MVDPLALTLSAAAGTVAGLAFFLSLQRTVARLPDSDRPWLLLVVSSTVRWALMAMALVAAVRLGGAPAAIAATLGIVLARQLLLRRTLATARRRVGG